MKRILSVLIFLPFSLFAQIGGGSTYEFVTLPFSAAENAFGGTVVSRTTKDLSFALKNPSLLDSTYSNGIVGNWGLLHMKETGIGLGTIGYAYYLPIGLALQSGIHFINYGKFAGYDEYGNSIESFVPAEYELIFGTAYSVRENLTVGVNLKPILSYMETYSSYGLLFDAAVSYRPERSCLSFEIRNVGWQLKPYVEGNREEIPYSIDLSFSQELAHAPIRFNVAYNDIQKFDLSYTENKKKNILVDGDDEERKFVTFGKNFLKHINLSAELLIGKHIVLMGGYNYRKSEELSFGSSKHGAGLGVGFALNFSRFNLSYGWAKQQAAGGRNFFTLNFNAETIYSICKTSIQKRKTSEL